MMRSFDVTQDFLQCPYNKHFLSFIEIILHSLTPESLVVEQIKPNEICSFKRQLTIFLFIFYMASYLSTIFISQTDDDNIRNIVGNLFLNISTLDRGCSSQKYSVHLHKQIDS